MGLASKMAQAGAGAPAGAPSSAPPPSYGAPPPGAYGQPPQQQQQQQQSPYGQPARAQTGYAPPPGPPPPGRSYTTVPPSGQYGAPPGAPPPPAGTRPGAPPSQSPYGQPPPQGQYGSQYGAPQNQYGQPQGQYGAPPGGKLPQDPYGQSGYGQQSPYGQQQPPPGQYGQQQQYGQPQQPYGQPPRPGPPASAGTGPASDPATVLSILRQGVQDQNIGAFYPPGSLEQLAAVVARSGAVQRLAGEWQIPMEIAMDLLKLALFDVVLYVDDSGSMAFEEGGSRIDDLKLIISRVALATSLFDQDGIQVRFMNSNVQGNNINSESAALDLVNQVKFSGLTPLGTALQHKVMEPLLLGPARQGRLQKPVLIIVVTDGVPGGEDRYTIVRNIIAANRELARTRYGSDALSIQLAQVGNDQKARAFLEELDSHPEVGGLIDTTSNYENEADDMLKANPPVELTPSLWIVKLLMGGIDSSYDQQDER